MFSRWLLLCLAVGLADGADPQGLISCSKFRPLKDLNITKLHGDWLSVAVTKFETGVPQPSSDHSDACMILRVFPNSTEDDVSCSLDIYKPGSVDISPLSHRVTADEKGRWPETDNPEMEQLILATESERYLVIGSCMQRHSSHVHWVIVLFSRYHEREAVLSEQKALAMTDQFKTQLGVSGIVTIKPDRMRCFDCTFGSAED